MLGPCRRAPWPGRGLERVERAAESVEHPTIPAVDRGDETLTVAPGQAKMRGRGRVRSDADPMRYARRRGRIVFPSHRPLTPRGRWWAPPGNLQAACRERDGRFGEGSISEAAMERAQ